MPEQERLLIVRLGCAPPRAPVTRSRHRDHAQSWARSSWRFARLQQGQAADRRCFSSRQLKEDMMQLPKVLSHALISAALASGGLVLAAGTSHATFSQCLDIVAAKGGHPESSAVQGACAEGARGKTGDDDCAMPIWQADGITLGDARAACQAAAVQP
ncbi:hypothetical protein ACWC4A_53745 [Streptomyces mirabilis]